VTVPFTVTAGPVGGGLLLLPWLQAASRSATSGIAARRRAALEVILSSDSNCARTQADNARDAKRMTRHPLAAPAALSAIPLRRAPARTPPASRRFLVGQVEQHGLDFLDVAVAHREELGDEPVVRRGHALTLRSTFSPNRTIESTTPRSSSTTG